MILNEASMIFGTVIGAVLGLLGMSWYGRGKEIKKLNGGTDGK